MVWLGTMSLENEKLKLLLEIEKEEKRRREELKINYYVPHPKQDAFHKDLAKLRCFLGGNRSGKTTAGAIETISYALGERPFYPISSPFRYTGKPAKIRIWGEDYTNHIGQVIVPKLKEWIPKNKIISTKKNQQGIPTYWEIKHLEGVSTIEILSYEQDPSKAEGWDGDLVWYDEPPPRGHFIASERGLIDRRGRSLITMTPIKEAWIYDEIYLQSDGKRYSVFIVDMDENPYLSEEDKQAFLDKLTDEEKTARKEGKFQHLTGLIYKEFNPQYHVIEPFELKEEDYSWYEAVDPHPRTPHAVLWLAVARDGTKYVVDEYFKHGTVEELARDIYTKRRGKRIVRGIIDPISVGLDPITGTTLQKELLDRGLFYEEASKDLTAGILRVKQALTLRNGRSEIYFFSTCERTLWEIKRYIWDEWKGTSKDTRDPKPKPKDKDDHMMECLYRLLLLEPQFVEETYSIWKPRMASYN